MTVDAVVVPEYVFGLTALLPDTWYRPTFVLTTAALAPKLGTVSEVNTSLAECPRF